MKKKRGLTSCIQEFWRDTILTPIFVIGEVAFDVLIPMMTHTMERSGHETARKRFSTIFIWLSLILCALTVAVSFLSLMLLPFATAERVILTLKLIPLVMPYSIGGVLYGKESNQRFPNIYHIRTDLTPQYLSVGYDRHNWNTNILYLDGHAASARFQTILPIAYSTDDKLYK